MQSCHQVFKSGDVDSNRLSLSLSVLFSETPNSLAKYEMQRKKLKPRPSSFIPSCLPTMVRQKSELLLIFLPMTAQHCNLIYGLIGKEISKSSEFPSYRRTSTERNQKNQAYAQHLLKRSMNDESFTTWIVVLRFTFQLGLTLHGFTSMHHKFILFSSFFSYVFVHISRESYIYLS